MTRLPLTHFGPVRAVEHLCPAELSRMHAHVATLVGATGYSAITLILSGWSLGSGWVVLALALVAAGAERSSVKLSSMLEESISLVPTLFAAVLFGPLAGMVVGAGSMLGDVRRPYLKWATYTCTRSLTGAATGFVAVGVEAQVAGDIESIAIGTAVGALAAQLLDIGSAALTLAIRRRATVGEVAATLAPAALLSLPLYAPVVALLGPCSGQRTA
jgi:ECF-type riboflavin transporter, S component